MLACFSGSKVLGLDGSAKRRKLATGDARGVTVSPGTLYSTAFLKQEVPAPRIVNLFNRGALPVSRLCVLP